MRPFKYTRPSDADAAARAVAANPNAKFLAGGTNILDLMKEDVERPNELVDLTRLKLAEITASRNGGVSIGAMAKNTDTANHPLIRKNYPLLTQAIVAAIREVHTGKESARTWRFVEDEELARVRKEWQHDETV